MTGILREVRLQQLGTDDSGPFHAGRTTSNSGLIVFPSGFERKIQIKDWDGTPCVLEEKMQELAATVWHLQPQATKFKGNKESRVTIDVKKQTNPDFSRCGKSRSSSSGVVS